MTENVSKEELRRLQRAISPHAHPAAPQGERSTGHGCLDRVLRGGVRDGTWTEVVGGPSTGRTSFMLNWVSAATRRHEWVAWVDLGDALDPMSAVQAGVSLDYFLWVRPEGGRPERQALQAVESLLREGGVHWLILDWGAPRARPIPSSSWFRLRRGIRGKPMAGVVLSEARVVTSAELRLRCEKTPQKHVAVERWAEGRGGVQVPLSPFNEAP